MFTELIVTAVLLPILAYSYKNRERNKLFVAQLKNINWSEDNRFWREPDPKCPGEIAREKNNSLEADIKKIEAHRWLSLEVIDLIKEKRKERPKLN